jgi:hypothetical protein
VDKARRDVVLLDARLPKCMVFDATCVNRWRWLQALLRPERPGLDGTGELGRRFGSKADDANKSSGVETEKSITMEQGRLSGRRIVSQAALQLPT